MKLLVFRSSIRLLRHIEWACSCPPKGSILLMSNWKSCEMESMRARFNARWWWLLVACQRSRNWMAKYVYPIWRAINHKGGDDSTWLIRFRRVIKRFLVFGLAGLSFSMNVDDGSKLTELINCKTMRSRGKHNQPIRQALIRLLTRVTRCPRAAYWLHTCRSDCLQLSAFFAHLRSAISDDKLQATFSGKKSNKLHFRLLDCLRRPQKSRS